MSSEQDTERDEGEDDDVLQKPSYPVRWVDRRYDPHENRACEKQHVVGRYPSHRVISGVVKTAEEMMKLLREASLGIQYVRWLQRAFTKGNESVESR